MKVKTKNENLIFKFFIILCLFLSPINNQQAYYPEKVVPDIDEMMVWTVGQPKPAYIIRAEYFAAAGATAKLYIIKQGIKLSPVQAIGDGTLAYSTADAAQQTEFVTNQSSELKDVYGYSVSTPDGPLGIKIEFPFYLKGEVLINYHLTIALQNTNGTSQTVVISEYGTGAEVILGTSAAVVSSKGYFIRMMFIQIAGNTTTCSLQTMEISTDGKATWTTIANTSTVITLKTYSATNTTLIFGFRHGVTGIMKASYYVLALSYALAYSGNFVYGGTTCSSDSDCNPGYLCDISASSTCQGK